MEREGKRLERRLRLERVMILELGLDSVDSGGSASVSLTKSPLSKEENFAMSSEDSSNPEGSGLELCLRLSLGGGGGKDRKLGFKERK
ncbi:hypothetical protein DVH24_034371 [Malus domestica]|uniref:Uncharacterized protein n=1 Tax=Malus domestica TaxID=3750 RepID=A0A498J209_MALDO|nr:hypothetical protein DVH24_034371 [Malus domestica]